MSDAEAIRIVALGAHHDRSTFACGTSPLDRYFQAQVGQDIKRTVTKCFVAENTRHRVLGFYTLAATGILLDALPQETKKKLPRHAFVPAALMGRLAVARDLQRGGLGKILIADALQRASASDIAAYALVVDAKDENAARYYSQFTFRPLDDDPLRLFLPLQDIRNAMAHGK